MSNHFHLFTPLSCNTCICTCKYVCTLFERSQLPKHLSRTWTVVFKSHVRQLIFLQNGICVVLCCLVFSLSLWPPTSCRYMYMYIKTFWWGQWSWGSAVLSLFALISKQCFLHTTHCHFHSSLSHAHILCHYCYPSCSCAILCPHHMVYTYMYTCTWVMFTSNVYM